MIQVGLTGWGDHPSLYEKNSRYKLTDYSAHFPVVELDSSFYAIPSARNVAKWLEETSDAFQFIPKAYQGMTTHQKKEEWPFDSPQEMFEAFRLAFEPMKRAGKLAFVLFQFPPSFRCVQKNVNLLRYIRQTYPDWPIAIEFRHRSWLTEPYKEGTLALLRELSFIHTIVDEPQIGAGSVPYVPVVTNEQRVFFRLHGRNDTGWINTFGSMEAWRKVRYLYEYSEEELNAFAQDIRRVAALSERVYVIFNNNSGHHASPNAKRLEQLLDISYEALASKQLDLFEGL